MTEDEKKAVYHELKRFRDHVEDVRRSLAPRQLSQDDYVMAIVDSMVDDADDVFAEVLGYKNQSIPDAIQLDKEIRRQEQEFMRLQQQQAEYNNKLNYLRYLEYLDDLLVILGKNDRWDGIQLLLIFFKESRRQELLVAEQLVQLNRLDDLSKLAKLWKQGRWADIQTVCGFAQQGRWDEVTVRLSEMTIPLESRNLFNESMLTGELKDMCQHYLLLKETNQVDEANKLCSKIADILESRSKKLNTAQIDVLKAKELRSLSSTNLPSQTSSQDVESTSNEKLANSFYDECANRFIEEYHLLCGENPGDDGKYPVYIWEEKFCHYRRVENLTELHNRLKKLSRSISLEMGYDRPILLTDQKN